MMNEETKQMLKQAYKNALMKQRVRHAKQGTFFIACYMFGASVTTLIGSIVLAVVIAVPVAVYVGAILKERGWFCSWGIGVQCWALYGLVLWKEAGYSG